MLAAVIVFLAGVVLVISADISVNDNPGHSISSISAPDSCKGKLLKWASDGSGWECVEAKTLLDCPPETIDIGAVCVAKDIYGGIDTKADYFGAINICRTYIQPNVRWSDYGFRYGRLCTVNEMVFACGHSAYSSYFVKPGTWEHTYYSTGGDYRGYKADEKDCLAMRQEHTPQSLLNVRCCADKASPTYPI